MPLDRSQSRRRPLALIVAATIVAACTTSSTTAPSPSPGGPASPSAAAVSTMPAPSPNPPIGGTLRVGLPALGDNAAITDLYVDPHRWFGMEEVLRCCLVRTLLSYNGRLTADGGAVLRPDLAETLPDVSADGLTWTFRLKPGLRHGPPYEDTEIAARDVIRGLERSIALGEVPFFDSIVGAAAYRDRQATTVSGLEAPDERTLVVRLDRPDGDIATALALPAASPIPPGVTDGHADDYGRFLVASGPYMYEGSEALAKGGVGEPLDAGLPAGTGVLVRNPSWDRATDALRGAWVDRIEFTRSASLEDDRTRLASGGVDIPGYQIKPIELQSVQNDPARRDRIAFASYPRLYFVPMNLALPPFDNVHVRRAINLVMDRAAIIDAIVGDLPNFTTLVVARHAIPDSFENNLLLDYDPYPSSGDHGDVAAAHTAMAESAYDTDGDGRCDAPLCTGIPITVRDEPAAPIVEAGLAELGITVVRQSEDANPYDPRSHNGSFVLAGWGADTPALGGFASLFSSPSEDFGSLSATLIGAEPDQLAAWGYATTTVSSVDNKLAECLALAGSERFVCAAELDQLVIEQAVALVPIAFAEVGFMYGDRVVAYSIDQSVVAPALDQIAVTP